LGFAAQPMRLGAKSYPGIPPLSNRNLCEKNSNSGHRFERLKYGTLNCVSSVAMWQRSLDKRFLRIKGLKKQFLSKDCLGFLDAPKALIKATLLTQFIEYSHDGGAS
jgi:hypothetical protein